jgi:aminopeptidase
MDPRNHQLARQLIEYSVKLQPGEKIYLEVKGLHALDLGKALIKAATEAGGVPFWYYNDEELGRQFIRHAGQEQFAAWGEFHRPIMEAVDAYIGVRGSTNPYDLADVPGEKMKWHDQAYWDQVHIPVRLKKKWCVLRYPNPAMAQLAEQPTETFADFYFDVCCLDYARLSRAMDPLADLIEKTDRVQITGPGTDLAFSIQGLGAVKCDGARNIPDGEVYTAPVRDSVNGHITYNAATMRAGVKFQNIRFEVQDGKIVQATCDGDSDKLNELLDVDAGGRYFGEFALGLNPYITAPMLDTLFDEKIGGSFHLTPGNAYEQAFNGNRSALHWDLVSIQTPDWGGGEIRFDDQVIRKDGRFVLPALEGLNPENLKSD